MMTKADIRETKRNLQELINDLGRHLEKGVLFWNTNPHYINIEKQVEKLRKHIINDSDYSLGIEVASYSRDSLHLAAAAYNKEGKKKSALILTSLVEELLEIELWLKEEYYHVPNDEAGNYFMSDGKLLNIYTMQEFVASCSECPVVKNDEQIEKEQSQTVEKSSLIDEQGEDDGSIKQGIDGDFANLKRFSPDVTLSLQSVFDCLIESNVIPEETTIDYFLKCVQFANYKHLINFDDKGKVTGKNNLKYTIVKITKHYFTKNKSEYKNAAATSLGIRVNDLGKGEQTKSFKNKIDILL